MPHSVSNSFLDKEGDMEKQATSSEHPQGAG
jgi:hypothetical protein